MTRILSIAAGALLSTSLVAQPIPLPPFDPTTLPPVPSTAVAKLPPSFVVPPGLVLDGAKLFTGEFSHGLRLQDFARIVLGDVLGLPFVFTADFLDFTGSVGFSAKTLEKGATLKLLQDVLAVYGFQAYKREGFYVVTQSHEPDERVDHLYRLKHRDLGYISAHLLPVFPPNSFTFQRGTSSVHSFGTNQGGKASGGAPVDEGGSLYSTTTRADSDLIIFRALPRDIERLTRLLEQLDTPTPRVMVRALILEVSDTTQQGYSLGAVADLLGSRLGISIGSTLYDTALTFKGGSFGAVASALQGNSSVKVLTAPSIIAETGANASLSVGNSVPTLDAIQYQGEGGASRQSVRYIDTGAILRFQPRILSESISLSFAQEISDAIQTKTGVNGSPTITKRQISTVLNVEDGEFVILGGLTSNKAEDSRGCFFLTCLIPSSKVQTQSSSDIVIVLQVSRV